MLFILNIILKKMCPHDRPSDGAGYNDAAMKNQCRLPRPNGVQPSGQKNYQLRPKNYYKVLKHKLA